MANEKIVNQKKEQVEKLASELKKSNLILLVDYKGINVAEVTKLRRDIAEANGTYSVLKNNIIKRALNANSESGLDDILVGTTALITSEEDYLSPLKAIYNYSKDHDFYKIKGGIVEGKVLSAEELIELAKLPSRQELLGMLAGALKSNISKLAVAVAEVSKKKEGEAA